MTRREWLALAAAAPLAAAPAQDIDRFFQDFMEQWVRADPEQATYMRLFTGDVQAHLESQLSDISDEAYHASIAKAKEGLSALSKFDRKQLTPAQRFSADMLEYQ